MGFDDRAPSDYKKVLGASWLLSIGARGMGNLLSPLKWDLLSRTESKSFAESLAVQDVVSGGKMDGHTSSQNRFALCKRGPNFARLGGGQGPC